MNTFVAILQRITGMIIKYIGVIIIAFTIWACWTPNVFSWTVSYTSIFLGVAMFGMGLSIKAQDFKIVWANPKEILLGGVLLQYTIMPITAYILCQALQLPTDIAIGVILVGCCPGGTASNVITYIAKGDVALSVGMTIASTLLAPLITPFLIFSLGGTWVDVSFLALVMSVIKVVLIPVLVGIVIHHFFGKKLEALLACMPLVSSIAIVMIIAGIISVNVSKIFTAGILVLAVVMLHNLIGMGLGLIASKILRTTYPKATAIAIEVGMQNSGLAVSLATLHFAMNPLATLPGAIFSVWHNISGAIFASIRQRHKGDEVAMPTDFVGESE
ncbi:bile acid:sodium symporter family protein [Veillonella criceti]|uniref:Bile acid transporter n=1 Tax=Veillonella criceti TaxID=103891 RepID=A0A380NPD5_9FIRM|nr:bile acid:sodium symporter family protein [Veillonella criceti]SUP44802.1 bile acid transporter [Veillonella criceti]